LTLTALPDIRSLEYITPAKAKSAFAGPTALGTDALSLPDEFFPASFELAIHRNVGEARLEKLAVTVHKLDGIEQVEIYRDWFKQLSSLITASRWAAGLLSVLVALCVLAVISHTVRLTAHERRAQIEVLKLCGATDRFITAPFVVEGAAQGLLSAFFAILLFFIGYALFQPSLASAMTVLIGINPTFLTPLTSLAVVVGGGLVGGLSGLISLRRYLDI
jgi:cell division transport system permease protein